MSRIIVARPLDRTGFAPFGQVIETEGAKHFPINNGMCERFDDLAHVEATGPDARVAISIFRAQPYPFPLSLSFVERHPFGSQAFIPLTPHPFLVVTCEQRPDGPGRPHAFVTAPGQGVNYPAGLWHGVLTPIGWSQDFLVVDRAGTGSNVEEHSFAEPWEIRLPGAS